MSKKSAPRQVFVQTVTHYYTGEVVSQDQSWLVLRRAAWIADTGRFTQAMADGVLSEVEPYPDDWQVRISVGSIVSICDWPHALPRIQK